MSYKVLLPGSRIVGEPNIEFTPEIAASLGAAWGTLLKEGTVTLARDFRPDSRMLKRAFVAGLMSAGINSIKDIANSKISLLVKYPRFFNLYSLVNRYTDKI